MRAVIAFILLCLVFTAFGEEPVSLIQNGLFNSNEGALAFWNVRNGGLGTMSSADGIFKAQVNELSERPWTMELHQGIAAAVPVGGLVVVGFEYNISAGYAFNFYWQVERSPWPKLLSLHLDKSDGWQQVRMAVPIHEALEERSTALSFHLGGCVGTLELRNVSVELYPKGTSPEEIETTVTPVLGGDFYDNDWREAAKARLLQLRQSDYTLKWKPNAAVHIRQTGRPFQFGVECPLSLFAGVGVPKSIDGGKLPEYRKILLERGLFDHITFSDGLIWRDYEKWGRQVIKEAVASVHAAGLKVHGHALYPPAFMFAPLDCRRMSVAQLNEKVQRHIAEEASIGGIDAWHVVHGALEYTEICSMIGTSSMLEAFEEAQRSASSAALLVSDVNALCSLSDANLRDTVEYVKWLRQNNVKLDGIVLGSVVNRPDVAPQAMERRLDYVMNELKLPIYIGGFAVNAENDEQHQAMMLDYLTLFFSHPGVYGVTFGEIWSAARLNPRMGLLDGELKESGTAVALRRLLQKEWRSELDVQTDNEGKASLRLFKGSYECSIGDEQMTIQVE